eukprot:m.183590 g.183590  ORF g.183590 m.183590 type:complete len:398 (-) comp18481_c0_seq11:267-1460(-)
MYEVSEFPFEQPVHHHADDMRVGQCIKTLYTMLHRCGCCGTCVCQERNWVELEVVSFSATHLIRCCTSDGAVAGVVLLFIAAVVLAWIYSANPFGLKGKGLGEVVVFFMFGPMLAAGTSVALCGSVVPQGLWYSIPIGLQTAAVLHVNNARDIQTDTAAGLQTLAIFLGPRGSAKLLEVLLLLVYSTVALLTMLENSTLRQWLVFACVPWALYVVRRSASGRYHELPQALAQHNLLFGAILIGALATPMFAMRTLIACLFTLGGFNNVIMWDYQSSLTREKMQRVYPRLSGPWCTACFAVASFMQTAVSIVFILGFHTVLMAKLLLTFLIVVTFVVHDFWTIEDCDAPPFSQNDTPTVAQQSSTVATFASNFDNEFVHFFKNVGMMGALVAYLEMFT